MDDASSWPSERIVGLCLILIITATSEDRAVLHLSALRYTCAVFNPQAVDFWYRAGEEKKEGGPCKGSAGHL